MKLAFVLVAFLSSFAITREAQKPPYEQLIAERKKQIEEQKRLLQKRAEKARQEVQSSPDSAEAHFRLAEALLKGTVTEDIFREIEAEYLKAIQLRPDYAEAFLGLAVIRGLWSKHEGQLEALKRAIAINPGYAEAYCKLGGTHLGHILGEDPGFDIKQEAKLAASQFNKAIEIKSELGEAHLGLGLSYYYLEMYAESLEAFKKAALLNPQDMLAHKALGSLYIRLEDEKAAMAEYEALIQLGEQFKIELEARGDSPHLNLPKAYAEDLLEEIKKRFVKK